MRIESCCSSCWQSEIHVDATKEELWDALVSMHESLKSSLPTTTQYLRVKISQSENVTTIVVKI